MYLVFINTVMMKKGWGRKICNTFKKKQYLINIIIKISILFLMILLLTNKPVILVQDEYKIFKPNI